MSYILDALRKSEHERRVGAVPTLENTPFDNPERSSQKPWIIILVAILICLNVGILLVITVFDQEDSTPHIDAADKPGVAEKAHIALGQPKQSKLVLNQNSAAQPSTMSTPKKVRKPQSKAPPPLRPVTKTAAVPTAARIPSATRPSSNTASRHTVQATAIASRTSNTGQTKLENHSKFSSNSQITGKNPALRAPESPQAQPDLVASPPQVPKSELPMDGNRKNFTEPVITESKSTVVAATPQRPRAISTSGTERKALLRLPAPELKSSVATAAPMAPSSQPNHSNTHRTTVQPKPPATEFRDISIPLLSNMNRDFQRQIPNLNINVFVYSEVPEERFVIINMVKYKNGQKLRDGPLLGEIRSDSIVLNYRGRDFRLSRP